MWPLWFEEESKNAAVCSYCGCVSLATMAVTLFARNVGFKVV